MNGRTMTQGRPWVHILKFALPVLAGSLLQQLYNTVDTIIVGRYCGQDPLSAVGTTGSFAFMLLAIAIGFSAGNGVVVAQHYGAGDEVKVRRTASTGIILLLGTGLVLTLLGFAVAFPAFKYFINVPDEIFDMSLSYFYIYLIGLVFQYGYNIFSAILRAVGDSAATLYFLLISSVLNIFLDIWFVKYLGWGPDGAAVATVISQLVSFVAAYFYMTRKYKVFRFRLKDFVWDGGLAKRTVIVGFPIALQMIIVSFGLTFIQRAVNGFGKEMTASFTVGNRIEMYMNLPCNAFQTTLATYTGQNIGAGKMDRVKKGAWQALLISVMMTLVVSAVVYVLSDTIVDAFSLEGISVEYCNEHLKTIALVNIVLSLYVPLFGVFQGSNHGGVPTVVATGALGVRVCVTYLLRYSEFLGYRIIWWNGLFGFSVGCMISWTYFLSGRWQKNSNLTGKK